MRRIGKEVKVPRTFRKEFLGLIVLLVLVSLGMLIAIPPLVMGDMINLHVEFSTVYEAEDFDLEVAEHTLETSDGYSISAFEVAVEDPKAVIIFMAGIHGPSVTAFYGHARMFQEHGYASILYDMRAHGKSEGELVSLGYLEVLDTQAVVDYINTQEQYRDLPIIVYGVSMGGVVAINSIGQIPEISGLVSLSAYSSWEDVFVDNMAAMGLPAFLTKIQRPFVKLYTIYKFGIKTADLYPKLQIQNLRDRPALIMHSTDDSQVPFANFERIMKKAPEHVETWIRPGDHHMMTTDFMHPENDQEYADTILEFFEQNFGIRNSKL